jgi:hypothetical protein
MRAAVAAMAECRRGWSAAGLDWPVMVLGGDVLSAYIPITLNARDRVVDLRKTPPEALPPE